MQQTRVFDPVFTGHSDDAVLQLPGISLPAEIPTLARLATIALVFIALYSLSVPVHAQNAPAGDGKLKMVVALFRHGIRPPLKSFACSANQYSGKAWPALEDWNAIPGNTGPQWGNLTEHGKLLAQALGRHYATHYHDILDDHGRGVSFWADVDERTQQTALGLKAGFCWPPASGIACRAQLSGLSGESTKDPLFHPFAAGCGTPDSVKLNKIASDIEQNQESWIKEPDRQLAVNTLQNTLNCNGEQIQIQTGCPPPPVPSKCIPLLQKRPDTAKPGEKPDSSPIKWNGVFSYASGSSEAFLLEYANNMAQDKVGWGQVNPPNSQVDPPNLGMMLQLHEFFFEKTDRQEYIAKIQGSNLVREILDDLERAAGRRVMGCPRGATSSKFIGLVGHDTNLASVGALLNLEWKFDTRFPGIPAKDALPAGALVFELRDRGSAGQPNLFVRIFYVTLTPQQMRDCTQATATPEPVWLPVTNPNCKSDSACEIPLRTFETMARHSLDSKFLSSCLSGRQICGNQKIATKSGGQ
jgi:4-phytase/acid phosphatase